MTHLDVGQCKILFYSQRILFYFILLISFCPTKKMEYFFNKFLISYNIFY